MPINIIFHRSSFLVLAIKLFRVLAVKLLPAIVISFLTTATLSANTDLPIQWNDDGFTTIEWINLMPEEDLEILSNPPEYIDDVADGSPEDQIDGQLQNEMDFEDTQNGIELPNTDMANTDMPSTNKPKSAEDIAAEERYQQALVSTTVVPEFNGKSIRIPGFIVPIEFNDDQTITQFFLVPYFGACIHMPPPPPNQIIFVDYPAGLKLEALYTPFWISGVIKTSLLQSDMATSAYRMTMETFELYEE